MTYNNNTFGTDRGIWQPQGFVRSDAVISKLFYTEMEMVLF